MLPRTWLSWPKDKLVLAMRLRPAQLALRRRPPPPPLRLRLLPLLLVRAVRLQRLLQLPVCRRPLVLLPRPRPRPRRLLQLPQPILQAVPQLHLLQPPALSLPRRLRVRINCVGFCGLHLNEFAMPTLSHLPENRDISRSSFTRLILETNSHVLPLITHVSKCTSKFLFLFFPTFNSISGSSTTKSSASLSHTTTSSESTHKSVSSSSNTPTVSSSPTTSAPSQSITSIHIFTSTDNGGAVVTVTDLTIVAAPVAEQTGSDSSQTGSPSLQQNAAVTKSPAIGVILSALGMAALLAL
jgi:hypothetical protein